jgi:DNA modification methylase
MMESSIKKYLNKVVQGDCLDVMEQFPSKSIDMILCDLPYGTTQTIDDFIYIKTAESEGPVLHPTQNQLSLGDI